MVPIEQTPYSLFFIHQHLIKLYSPTMDQFITCSVYSRISKTYPQTLNILFLLHCPGTSGHQQVQQRIEMLMVVSELLAFSSFLLCVMCELSIYDG